MTASLLITAFLFGLPVMQYQTYNQDGVIKGFQGIAYAKEQYRDQSVTLTDEYITETIRAYQHLFENPDNIGYDGNEQFLVGDAYWDFVAPREKLLRMIASNYDNPGESSGLQKLPGLDLTNGSNFYQARSEKIKKLLDTPSRNLSDSQKEYWENKISNVKTPLQYGYYEGWEIIISSFELLMFALLAVCIVIAPVFSGEYQAGTDAVILSGKYGKTKLITAKIVSSFLFGILAFTLHAVVAFGIPLAAFGTDGWDLPVQIANTVIPYSFTFMESALVNLGIIYLVLFAMISLTLLLSSIMRNTVLVPAILVPVIFLPIFLTPDGTTGAYNLILFLLPYRSAMPELGKYISYQFGGVVLNALSVRALLYVLLIFVMIPFAKFAFRKHQVSV